MSHALSPVILRARGASPDALVLAAELDALDEERWSALLPELATLARNVARRYPDVVAGDDALGELALRAWDGWLADWAGRVREGVERRSLWTFLGHRLAAHLKELRRREARRRRLLAPLSGDAAGPDGALFARHLPRPDEPLAADELRASVSADEQAQAIVLLRESGFSHGEIADALGVSRPTVTRRLAAAAAAIAAAIALASLAAWAWPRGPRPAEILPEHPAAPSTAGETPVEAPAPQEPKPPEPVKPSEIVLLQTAPAHAEVLDAEGNLLGHAPIAIARPAPGEVREVLLRVPGYVQRTFTFGEHTARAVTITLDARPPGRRAPRDPFAFDPPTRPPARQPWWDRRR